jgi:alpha-tubulin suppressor-like RCC1 family protein
MRVQWLAIYTLGMISALLSQGCAIDAGSESTGEFDEQDLGKVELLVRSVPTGVGCIRIFAAGTTANFTLAAGSSTVNLSLGRLPPGNTTVSGAAYATSCGTGEQLYVADSVTVNLDAGTTTSVELTFRINNALNVSANFVGQVAGLAAAFSPGQAYATVGGRVYEWASGSSAATEVGAFTDAKKVAASTTTDTACALRANGTIFCWGTNGNAQAGATSPATVPRTAPIQAGVHADYVDLALGDRFTCGLRQNRSVYCWGSDSTGQLGNGTGDSSGPTPVLAASSVAHLSAQGSSAVVADLFADFRGWGDNASGQLATGNTTTRWSPLTSTFALAPIQVSTTGLSSCALAPNGTIQCVGSNSLGQLGRGTITPNELTPALVSGISTAAEVTSGLGHVCARLKDFTVRCWGQNADGTLGDGTKTNRSSPVSVLGGLSFGSISAGRFHQCGLTRDEQIYCWGNGANPIAVGSSLVPSLYKLP